MSNHTDPVFGVLNDDAHGYWSTTIKHGDREIRADLNIDGDIAIDIAIEHISKFSQKLGDSAALEALARTALLADTEKKRSAVKTFRDRHAEALEAIESATCIPATKEDIGAFLQLCELKRIALYPECPGHCMILDFGLRSQVTDYMLVVSFDGEDRVVGVDLQS
ncbi:MAG: hypothetical protein ACI8UD_003475 [Planctomycetota bacterium]|jgi:hypothetical protein